MTIVCGTCPAERVSWTAGEKLICGVKNDWDGESFILAAERMLVRDAETCFGPWVCVTGMMGHVVGRGDARLRC